MTGEEYGELFREACELFENNEYDRAEEICNKLIEVNDKQAPIFNLLALIKDKKGDIESAINNSERSINLDKNNYFYLCNIGELYRKNNNLSLALEYLNKSLQINSNYYLSLYNIANVYRVIGYIDKAKIYYELSIKLNPNFYQALNNLGLLYVEMYCYELAESYYKRALKIKLNDCEIIINLSLAQINLKKFDEAEENLKNIISLVPDYVESYRLLGLVYLEKLNIDKSIEYHKKYLDLVKNKLSKSCIKVHELKISLLSSDFFNNSQEIDNNIKNIHNIVNTKYIYGPQFLKELNQEGVFFSGTIIYNGRDNKNLKLRFSEVFQENVPIYKLKKNKGKIKIGFLVTKEKEGIFVRFMKNIINGLDSHLFDVYIMCYEQSWKQYLNSHFNENLNPIFLSLDILKDSINIQSINLDILYFWEIGTDSTNYFLAFFRMAQIQCTSIGWPETTGISNVDYFISSDLLEIETAKEHYSEILIKTIKLPFAIQKSTLENITNIKKFGINSDKKIYFCVQTIRKIHPDFDYVIQNILKKDPNALIIFSIKDKNNNLYDLLKNRLKLITKELFPRIIFLEQISYQEFLSLIIQSDIILDTLYFGGITTAYDCFSMDIPIVTYPWIYARGRYTLGCYKQMGIEGLIANSLDEYVDLAIKTANDNDFRAKIVKDIKDNKHKLFEDKELINEYNNLFRKLANR